MLRWSSAFALKFVILIGCAVKTSAPRRCADSNDDNDADVRLAFADANCAEYANRMPPQHFVDEDVFLETRLIAHETRRPLLLSDKHVLKNDVMMSAVFGALQSGVSAFVANSRLFSCEFWSDLGEWLRAWVPTDEFTLTRRFALWNAQSFTDETTYVLRTRPPPQGVTFRQRQTNEFDIERAPCFSAANTASYLEQCFSDQRKLSNGTFGHVWKARSLRDGRWYAIKRVEIVSQYGANELTPRDAALREVEAWERIADHPNINAFHAAWREVVVQQQVERASEEVEKEEEEELLFFQSPLCREDLGHYLTRSGRVPTHIAWCLLTHMLAAFAHLDAHGFVYPDIKKENALICDAPPKFRHERTSGSRRVVFKLSDFGLMFDRKKDDPAIAKWICRVMENGDHWELIADGVRQCRLESAIGIAGLGLMMLQQVIGLDLYRTWLNDGGATKASLDEARTMIQRGAFANDPDLRPSARKLLESAALKRHRSECAAGVQIDDA